MIMYIYVMVLVVVLMGLVGTIGFAHCSWRDFPFVLRYSSNAWFLCVNELKRSFVLLYIHYLLYCTLIRMERMHLGQQGVLDFVEGVQVTATTLLTLPHGQSDACIATSPGISVGTAQDRETGSQQLNNTTFISVTANETCEKNGTSSVHVRNDKCDIQYLLFSTINRSFGSYVRAT